MGELERRPIEEVFYRLEQEPSMFDCVVEGHADRVLIEWVLSHEGLDEARVVEIEDLLVGPELFGAGALDSGNRSRVMKVAEIADERYSPGEVGLVCLADRDLDDPPGGEPTESHLIVTTGTSLDSLFVRPDVLDCVLAGFLELRNVNAEEVFADLVFVCRELFLARAADRKLGLNAGWLDPEPECTVAGGRTTFDYDRYHRRYCEREGMRQHTDSFVQAVADLRGQKEARELVHGHDYVRAFRRVARALGADGQMCAERVLRRALRSCLGVGRAAEDPAVAVIVERARRRVVP